MLPIPPPVWRGLAWFMFGAVAGIACIQGHRVDPPKPLGFDPPKVETLKLYELFAVGPILPARPVPGSEPAVIPRLATTTTAEQQAVFVAYVREFEAQRAKAAGVKDSLAHGVSLIQLGQYPDAIEALLALEAARPGRYEIAASLGMAHELAGNLEEAVIWIARGMERNAGSRQGTEWLHAGILHAKSKLREDPHWLKTHGVLDGAAGRSTGEVIRAIEYQLGERLNCVKPLDAIVCDLFYQMAMRIDGPDAGNRRAYYLAESLRFGDWRKAEIANRPKT